MPPPVPPAGREKAPSPRPPSSHREPGRYGDGRRVRIGLLGGSFNPAHTGHRHVAEMALHVLRLDEVWMLVSPGNPLKPSAGMASFEERLDSARRVADGRRVIAVDIEARLGLRETERTLSRLRRLFPRAEFVWIMGADNMVQLPRWRRWRKLARGTPIAVLPRPGYTRRALHGAAAGALRQHRRPCGMLMAEAARHPGAHAPWCLVPAREHPASATAIRALRANATTATSGPSEGSAPAALHAPAGAD
ncbi:nicotinate-nucleotide adenylyltransferase [Roseomonas indoligenes]|uniref:Probable nicotinate-nucleotide adenylyltransferase n=1 Tax=Roseomonas indoligenes TaxID=2820811 RepID=A0A940N5D2_9PROT|nr:nicotinate-nucleotide adenylyltransferase [Pararoseomonas indoligenes]MBP0494452.1 nicotinate-nucleotide adenylyltransferase [Pararoseomonas indoligenes]